MHASACFCLLLPACFCLLLPACFCLLRRLDFLVLSKRQGFVANNNALQVPLDLRPITNKGHVRQTTSLLFPGRRSDSFSTTACTLKRPRDQTFAWRHPDFNGCLIQIDPQHRFRRRTQGFQQVPPRVYRGHLRTNAKKINFDLVSLKNEQNLGPQKQPNSTRNPSHGPRLGAE